MSSLSENRNHPPAVIIVYQAPKYSFCHLTRTLSQVLAMACRTRALRVHRIKGACREKKSKDCVKTCHAQVHTREIRRNSKDLFARINIIECLISSYRSTSVKAIRVCLRVDRVAILRAMRLFAIAVFKRSR